MVDHEPAGLAPATGRAAERGGGSVSRGGRDVERAGRLASTRHMLPPLTRQPIPPRCQLRTNALALPPRRARSARARRRNLETDWKRLELCAVTLGWLDVGLKLSKVVVVHVRNSIKILNAAL